MNTTLTHYNPTPQDYRATIDAIDRAPLQPSTRYKYRREIEALYLSGINPADFPALQSYADTLKSSRKQFLKSALRIVTSGIEQELKANADPTNLKETQAALLRLEALNNAVQAQTPKGTKAHTWLSQSQVSRITAACPDTLEGRRDWIVLAVLLGAGLRREELAELTFDSLKQQPMKGGKMRDVLEVTGKGNKTRVIPISEKLGARLREWRGIVNGGHIARSLGRAQQLGESMSAASIYELVNKYGRKIGIEELAPHDLRRTYAQLGYEAGVPITQISTLLGHANVATTQKYLNMALDLESTASDFIPLS